MALLLFFSTRAEAQRIREIDFRNQKVADILMALAEMGKRSILVDDTVTGTATFHFTDSEFEESLSRFTDACRLFYTMKDNAYYVSRIKVEYDDAKQTAKVFSEDVDLEKLIKSLSRAAGKTILYDALPREQISVHEEGSSVRGVLRIIMKKYSEYSVEEEDGCYYIRKTQDAVTGSSASGRVSSSAIRKEGELYSMNVARGSFPSILAQLFKTAKKEYSLLQRVDASLENLYFENKTFDQLLRIVLEQANCDYAVEGTVYYVFQVERRDIVKKFKNTIVVQLQNISVTDVAALLPPDFSGSSFMRLDRNTNTAYLTGSEEELKPLVDFLELIDVPSEDKAYMRFEVKFLAVKDFLALLPKELMECTPQIIPGTNDFTAKVSSGAEKRFRDCIRLLDRKSEGESVRLKYLRTDDLIKNLPPSINKEEIAPTSDPSVFFFTGTKEKLARLRADLRVIDRPKAQIRYQLLIMQYQKSNGFSWGDNSYSLGESAESAGYGIAGSFASLLSIQFDIVSEFGYKLAAELNAKLTEDKAKVLADTTLNGISGQDIKFENTDVYRYRDYTVNTETGEKTGVTREIASGIILKINGWVSGDGMITMDVSAEVSKQDDAGDNGDSTKNPPPSSERAVTTQVRTKSGTPIIIGGLLQMERAENVNKIPILAHIPLIGKLFQNVTISDVSTEMVIYIVPYVHIADGSAIDYRSRNEEYYRKYVLREAS